MSTEQQWRARLMKRARGLGLCEEDAEDLVQDVLLAFWLRHARTLPWEYPDGKVAEQHCLRLLRDKHAERKRRKSTQREVLQSELEGRWEYAIVQTESEMLEQVHCTELLSRLCLALSPRQRPILALLEQGCTEQEIAQRLAVSEGTVKSQVNRIRKKASELLTRL